MLNSKLQMDFDWNFGVVIQVLPRGGAVFASSGKRDIQWPANCARE
jgi:hypothetical protein